jgi:hypothetical protein
MLRGTVAFLVLVAFALLGTELRTALARRGLRAPAMEGLSFLAIGFALGDRVLGLFPADVLVTLRVVVLLGLAWIGLVFGLQIELRVLRHLRPWHRRVGWSVPLLIGTAVAVCGFLLGVRPWLVLSLAAVAMAPAPSTLEGVVRGRVPADRAAFRLLKLVVAFAGLPAVAVFGVASAWASPLSDVADGLSPWQLLLCLAGIGVVVGYLSLVLVRGVREPVEIVTLLIGTMAGLAGATALLGVSALPAATCSGAVLINRAAFPHRILRVAHSIERPLVIALLVLVGASWTGVAFSGKVFAVMVVGRVLGALLGGRVLAGQAGRQGVRVVVPGLGLGLLPQGELALGLLVALVGFSTGTEGVLEAVVAAMVVHQIAGRWWLGRHLVRRADGGPG